MNLSPFTEALPAHPVIDRSILTARRHKLHPALGIVYRAAKSQRIFINLLDLQVQADV